MHVRDVQDQLGAGWQEYLHGAGAGPGDIKHVPARLRIRLPVDGEVADVLGAPPAAGNVLEVHEGQEVPRDCLRVRLGLLQWHRLKAMFRLHARAGLRFSGSLLRLLGRSEQAQADHSVAADQPDATHQDGQKPVHLRPKSYGSVAGAVLATRAFLKPISNGLAIATEE